MSEWQSYPDSTIRETYPALSPTGGNPNKEAPEVVIASVVSRHAMTRQQEAEFRARQYARRLQTRGIQAMREPEDSMGFSETPGLPDDPELDIYKQAGWLG